MSSRFGASNANYKSHVWHCRYFLRGLTHLPRFVRGKGGIVDFARVFATLDLSAQAILIVVRSTHNLFISTNALIMFLRGKVLFHSCQETLTHIRVTVVAFSCRQQGLVVELGPVYRGLAVDQVQYDHLPCLNQKQVQM